MTTAVDVALHQPSSRAAAEVAAVWSAAAVVDCPAACSADCSAVQFLLVLIHWLPP